MIRDHLLRALRALCASVILLGSAAAVAVAQQQPMPPLGQPENGPPIVGQPPMDQPRPLPPMLLDGAPPEGQPLSPSPPGMQPPSQPSVGQPMPGQPMGQPFGQSGNGQPGVGPRPMAPQLQPQQQPADPHHVTQGRPLDQRPLGAPFELSPQAEAYLNQVLSAWEKETVKVKTFRSAFIRWDYTPGVLPAQFKDEAVMKNTGKLEYSAPDRGSFEITDIRRFDPKTGKHEPAPNEIGDHWVCTGKSIYEYKAKEKQVIERPIPPELQGKAISDGPLPFLFGAEAMKLKRRYFLRIITPQQFTEKEIWVDAFPRYQSDAANFQRAILRLTREKFEPMALRIYDPAGGYQSYQFESVQINPYFENIRQLFAPPRVPWGWKKVLELPPQASAAPPANPSPDMGQGTPSQLPLR